MSAATQNHVERFNKPCADLLEDNARLRALVTEKDNALAQHEAYERALLGRLSKAQKR